MTATSRSHVDPGEGFRVIGIDRVVRQRLKIIIIDIIVHIPFIVFVIHNRIDTLSADTVPRSNSQIVRNRAISASVVRVIQRNQNNSSSRSGVMGAPGNKNDLHILD